MCRGGKYISGGIIFPNLIPNGKFTIACTDAQEVLGGHRKTTFSYNLSFEKKLHPFSIKIYSIIAKLEYITRRMIDIVIFVNQFSMYQYYFQ